MFSPGSCQPDGTRRRDVVDDAEHADDRRREDRLIAGLVVERDVAAGDRDAELEAAVRETLDGPRELPHDLGVLGAAEVQAVRHCGRHRTGDGDVAVGLGEGELRALVRIELAEAAVAVGGDREAEAGVLVDADHAGVIGERQRRVAHHEVVVLVGHPRRCRRGSGSPTSCVNWRRSVSASTSRASSGCRVIAQRVDPRRVGDRALVDRAVDRDRRGVDVHDLLAVPEDLAGDRRR